MSPRHSSPHCEFCEKLSQPTGLRAPNDFQVVAENASAVAVAAMGPLSIGHALIMPRRHVPSTSHLTPEEFRALLTLVETVGQTIHALADSRPVVIFENGSAWNSAPRQASCIEHAHWNLLHTDASRPRIAKTLLANALACDFVMPEPARAPYVLWVDQTGIWFGSRAQVKSQELRRRIAEAAGVGEEWDYLVYPRNDDIARTVDLFRPIPAHQASHS